MKRYFLDTNAWLDLLKQRNPQADIAFLARTASLADHGFAEVVMSFEISEELLDEKAYDPERFRGFVAYIVHITCNRLLLPFNFRIGLEFVFNRSLEPDESYFPFVSGIWELMRTPGLETVPQEVAAIKKKYRQTEIETSDKLEEKLIEVAGGKGELSEAIPGWIKELSVSADSWHDDFLQKLAVAAKGKRHRTAYSFFLFEMAKQHLLANPELSAKRRAKLCSMNYDQKHYTDARASQCDYIVTRDEDLTEIANNIQEQVSDSPEPISFAEFVRHVKALPWLG